MKVLSIVTNKHSPFYQNQIKALEDVGCDITQLAPGDQSEDYQEQQNISRSPVDYLRLWPRILHESRKGYDVIHANNGKVAPFALAQFSCPVVLTLWGTDLMERYGKVCRICSRFADEVIVPSSAMSPHLPVGHSIIPFGVDTDLFSPMSMEEARDEVGWSQEDNIVLFPYPTARDVKNYPLAKRVTNQVESAELRQIPAVPHKEVPLYMNASDCVLVTSNRESGPMTVKEAALCNTPVVSTDVGFVASVLSDVEHSFVCNSEDEMVSHLESIVSDGVRSDGEKYADEWGLERMGERLTEIYGAAISPK